jgi:hypothetical protein
MQEASASDRNTRMNDAEKVFISKYDIDQTSMNMIKHAVASEAVKQGYVALRPDKGSQTIFKRTEDHRIMEMFDFVVTINK